MVAIIKDPKRTPTDKNENISDEIKMHCMGIATIQNETQKENRLEKNRASVSLGHFQVIQVT